MTVCDLPADRFATPDKPRQSPAAAAGGSDNSNATAPTTTTTPWAVPYLGASGGNLTLWDPTPEGQGPRCRALRPAPPTPPSRPTSSSTPTSTPPGAGGLVVLVSVSSSARWPVLAQVLRCLQDGDYGPDATHSVSLAIALPPKPSAAVAKGLGRFKWRHGAMRVVASGPSGASEVLQSWVGGGARALLLVPDNVCVSPMVWARGRDLLLDRYDFVTDPQLAGLMLQSQGREASLNPLPDEATRRLHGHQQASPGAALLVGAPLARLRSWSGNASEACGDEGPVWWSPWLTRLAVEQGLYVLYPPLHLSDDRRLATTITEGDVRGKVKGKGGGGLDERVRLSLARAEDGEEGVLGLVPPLDGVMVHDLWSQRVWNRRALVARTVLTPHQLPGECGGGDGGGKRNATTSVVRQGAGGG
jgi:hypothetical protein